jgi:LuxR family maltose regulon positive regulatory protein
MEVLVLLARRFTNDEIARELVVSLPTVKTHAAHIYAKLGATGRQQAVSRARRLGILAT